jgi:glycosyltransferase involved in cell wall biosynthesis
VLVIGQVPPPFGGQTIMTAALLAGRYRDAELFHVNAAYSTSLADMGRVSVVKLARVAVVLGGAVWTRLRHRTSVLYYHPAGANRGAILRDLVLLPVLRPMFSTVVFHLHARGLPEALASLPRPLRAVARRAYARPDVVLGPSGVIVEEAVSFEARINRVIPNGIAGGQCTDRDRAEGEPVRILYLNLISEAKGAGWLLEAVGEMRDEGLDVELLLAGEFASSEYRDALLGRVHALGLEDSVKFRGVVTGRAKWQLMAESDIFCVPTTWPQESFGLAMVEAASSGLPVVTADVPGVRGLFDDGRSVLLADPADDSTLRPLLERLCRDPGVRQRFGREARSAFEQRYTVERYWEAIGTVFTDLTKETTDVRA